MTTIPAPAAAGPAEVHVPDTRRLAPEADPAIAPGTKTSDATVCKRLGDCLCIAGAVGVLIDRMFQNLEVDDMVHQHHVDPANAANASGS